MGKIISLFLILFTSLAFSQQEASVWYFGSNAGIKFDASGNVTALTDGQLNTSEGCATIADSNGNLLFYTDGITIWNKNHQIMSNGTGLMGNWSSSQSATIVPMPGSTTLYYVFTLDYEAHANGFRYSIVDMSLNGGLGDVNSSKNILIYTPSNEKLSIVKHANGMDYWVVTHGWNNNTFYSYLLTSTGLSTTPVTSNVGAITNGTTQNVYGCMKISPDGTKIAICNSHIDAEVLDFSTTTGLVTNATVLFTGSGLPDSSFAYGVEFSPDSRLLYVINTGYYPLLPRQLIQYDLTNSSTIVASAQIINSVMIPDAFPTGLQLAPNGKIYSTLIGYNKLAVINSPNTVGLGCSFQMDAVDLAGRFCQFGLPPFVSSFFNATFKTQNLCLGSTTQFTIDTSQSVTSASWNFGDGSTSTVVAPSHQYANSGSYTVTVTATTANGTNTKTKVITIYQIPIANIVANQTNCDSSGATYDLSQHSATLLGGQSTTTFGVTYFSTMTDLVNHANALPIQYTVPLGTTTIYAKVYNLENTSCYAFQTFTITKYLRPISNIISNTFICDDASNDGVGSFNLDATTVTVLGTQSSTYFKVSYYSSQSDANIGINPLPLNYQNTSNPQTIYIRIENKLSSTCFDASQSFQIGLYKMPTANHPPNLYLCDVNNDGTESFDLTPQSSVVLGSQLASDYTITYHNTLNDATLGVNALSMIQTVINAKTIYIRIENKLSAMCFATTSFQLIVKPKPVLVLNDTYTICQGTSITITASSGFTSYSWSTGSHTNSAFITQAGNYSLTVTKDYGTIICDATKNFTVYNSNVATITSIATQDWTDSENAITVFVTGDGDYEYSLDNIHFQDSNQFYGLQSGEYTVYVKDKKGCGTIQEDVFLLMYPKFFTPNGDGVNDEWNVHFSITEPNMFVTIYDRYGKVVDAFKGKSPGWNGTLNGKLLPADDYWFVVKRGNGREYRGHFSLVR